MLFLFIHILQVLFKFVSQLRSLCYVLMMICLFLVTDPFPSMVSFVENTISSISINHTSVPGAVNYTVRAVNNGTGNLHIYN